MAVATSQSRGRRFLPVRDRSEGWHGDPFRRRRFERRHGMGNNPRYWPKNFVTRKRRRNVQLRTRTGDSCKRDRLGTGCPKRLIKTPMPKTPKGQKRPADVISNAVHVMKIATGEIDEPLTEDGKNAAA